MQLQADATKPSIVSINPAHPVGRLARLIPYLVCIPPFVLLLWFIGHYGINVPFLDQWAMPYVFIDIHRHSARVWHDIWGQHNEHRIFFPQLVWISLAYLTRWNTKWEMFTSALLAAATCVGVIRIANRQRHRGDQWSFLMSLFFCSAVMFSLSQFDNWLWGFELAFVIVPACFVWAVFWLTNDRYGVAARLAGGIMLCFVATFSCGQGLVSWIAAAPCVGRLTHRRRLPIWALWFLGCAIAVALYHSGWKPPGGMRPPANYSLHHPIEALGVFLALLGMNFASGSGSTAILCGTVLMILVLVAALLLIRQPALRLQSLPWISLGLFSLGFGILVMVGRAGWGLDSVVFTARYTSVAVLLIVALAQCYRLFLCCGANQVLFCAAIFVVCAFVLPKNSAYGVTRGSIERTDRELGRDCLDLIDYLDSGTDGYPGSCVHTLYPIPFDSGLLRERQHLLEIVGFRHPQHHAVFVPGGGYKIGDVKGFRVEASDYPIRVADAKQVTVWGDVLAAAHSSSLVLLSYPGHKKFVSGGLARGPARGLAMSTWQISFPAKFAPDLKLEPTAWVYDPKTAEFLQLQP